MSFSSVPARDEGQTLSPRVRVRRRRVPRRKGRVCGMEKLDFNDCARDRRDRSDKGRIM